MSTPRAPSARPPSSRRFEALDSPAAKAFVEGADLGAGGVQAAAAEPLRQVLPAELVTVSRGPRKERMQPVTLRLSEVMHAQLLHIADNGKRSMNQFIIDVLGPAVSAEIEKIERRKALGLD